MPHLVDGQVLVHLTDANGVVIFDHPTIIGIDGGEAGRLDARLLPNRHSDTRPRSIWAATRDCVTKILAGQ
jgi:hypothetical protein